MISLRNFSCTEDNWRTVQTTEIRCNVPISFENGPEDNILLFHDRPEPATTPTNSLLQLAEQLDRVGALTGLERGLTADSEGRDELEQFTQLIR